MSTIHGLCVVHIVAFFSFILYSLIFHTLACVFLYTALTRTLCTLSNSARYRWYHTSAHCLQWSLVRLLESMVLPRCSLGLLASLSKVPAYHHWPHQHGHAHVHWAGLGPRRGAVLPAHHVAHLLTARIRRCNSCTVGGNYTMPGTSCLPSTPSL